MLDDADRDQEVRALGNDIWSLVDVSNNEMFVHDIR